MKKGEIMKLEKIKPCVDCNIITHRCILCYEEMEVAELMEELIKTLEQLPKSCQKNRIQKFIEMTNLNLLDNKAFGECIYCPKEVDNE